jgi:hypothetical protein
MFLADLVHEFWLDLVLAAVSVTHWKPNLFILHYFTKESDE